MLKKYFVEFYFTVFYFYFTQKKIFKSFCFLIKTEHNCRKIVYFFPETEVKNEVQECPENESVPGSELYIDENAEEKDHEFPDSMEKADYNSIYGNSYYNR